MTLSFVRRIKATIDGKPVIVSVYAPTSLENMRIALANQRMKSASDALSAADAKRQASAEALDKARNSGTASIDEIMAMAEGMNEAFNAVSDLLYRVADAEDEMNQVLCRYIKDIELDGSPLAPVLFRRSPSSVAEPWAALTEGERLEAMRHLDRVLMSAVVEAMGSGARFEDTEK